MVLSNNNGCIFDTGSATYEYHGDDAQGQSENCLVVADGVSGTLGQSGILAKALVKAVLVEMKLLTGLVVKPVDFINCVEKAVKIAKNQLKHAGRLDSTLSVMYMDGSLLYTYTLGDCKGILIRNGVDIVFETSNVVYDFNVPAVISTNDSISAPQYAKVEVTEYQMGDIALLFSDGVSDNLFAEQILKIVQDFETMDEIAKNVVRAARNTLEKVDIVIPFTVSAAKACMLRNNPMPEVTSEYTLLDKEHVAKSMQYYRLDTLKKFAMRSTGKRDDISVSVAKINHVGTKT